jgi:hypothetical protein
MRRLTSIRFVGTAALAVLLAAGAGRADDAPQSEAPFRAEEDTGEQEADQARPVTLRLDQGFVLDMPPGWELERAADDPGDATGRMRVRTVCRTPACRRTQETCTFVLRRDSAEGADDAERLAGLHATPLSRYLRLRTVLERTSLGATIRQPLGPVEFGPHTWIAVETNAAGRFKSGLFAETVIDGRYLGATCRTCETGEDRHTAARAMLASVRRVERSASR